MDIQQLLENLEKVLYTNVAVKSHGNFKLQHKKIKMTGNSTLISLLKNISQE